MALSVPNEFAVSAVEEQMVTLENNTREVGSFLLLVLLPKGLVLWCDKFPKCTKQSLETNWVIFKGTLTLSSHKSPICCQETQTQDGLATQKY